MKKKNIINFFCFLWQLVIQELCKFNFFSQIAVTLDAVDRLNVDAVFRYVQRLQQNDGSFVGDVWGEVDTRLEMSKIYFIQILFLNSDQKPKIYN